MRNAIESLGLNNLRIIRGETVFASQGEADVPTWYSLYITLNYHVDHLPVVGLLELQLTSLRGVQRHRIANTAKFYTAALVPLSANLSICQGRFIRLWVFTARRNS